MPFILFSKTKGTFLGTRTWSGTNGNADGQGSAPVFAEKDEQRLKDEQKFCKDAEWKEVNENEVKDGFFEFNKANTPPSVAKKNTPTETPKLEPETVKGSSAGDDENKPQQPVKKFKNPT